MTRDALRLVHEGGTEQLQRCRLLHDIPFVFVSKFCIIRRRMMNAQISNLEEAANVASEFIYSEVALRLDLHSYR